MGTGEDRADTAPGWQEVTPPGCPRGTGRGEPSEGPRALTMVSLRPAHRAHGAPVTEGSGPSRGTLCFCRDYKLQLIFFFSFLLPLPHFVPDWGWGG